MMWSAHLAHHLRHLRMVSISMRENALFQGKLSNSLEMKKYVKLVAFRVAGSEQLS